MNTPQTLTIRYVNNLLRTGQNNEYSLITLQAHDNVVGGDLCGLYYKIQIRQRTNLTGVQTANGATPENALRNALEKYGVTFR